MRYCSRFLGGCARCANNDAARRVLLAVWLIVLTACEQATPEAAVEAGGAALYQQHCAACHGEQGRGAGQIFPPLAGSEWLHLPDRRLAEIVLRGLNGELAVAGKTYRGAMPAQRHLDDATIAKILTYIRTRWRRPAAAPATAAPVTTAQVAAVRTAVSGLGPLRGEELVLRGQALPGRAASQQKVEE